MLRCKFDALHLYDFVFVFFHANKNDSSGCIQKAYNCLGQVKFDGLVLEGPMIVLEFLIATFSVSSSFTRRSMLKVYAATQITNVFILNEFHLGLNPIEA